MELEKNEFVYFKKKLMIKLIFCKIRKFDILKSR